MLNKTYALTPSKNFTMDLLLTQKRYTSSKKVSSELVPWIKKEVLDSSSSIKSVNIGHNLVAKPDFSSRILHPMTPVFNPGLPAHVAAVNAPNTFSTVFDKIQQSNSLSNSYTHAGSIYKNSFYAVPDTKLFNVFHEGNIATCFHKSRVENNVITTPFIGKLKNAPGYVQNPNQARPDVLLDCRNSNTIFKGIQSYDHKAVYTKTLYPGKVYTYTMFYGVDSTGYKNSLTDFVEKYKAKHGFLSPDLNIVLHQLEAHSHDIETQTSIITDNLHLFDPLLLPSVRTPEFFYMKHCTDEFVSDVTFAQGKNNFVSSLLYNKNVPVGIAAKTSGAILHNHKDLLNIINDYAA